MRIYKGLIQKAFKDDKNLKNWEGRVRHKPGSVLRLEGGYLSRMPVTRHL